MFDQINTALESLSQGQFKSILDILQEERIHWLELIKLVIDCQSKLSVEIIQPAFDPDISYCIRRTSPGAKAENLKGEFLNQLLAKGQNCPHDFWVMGFTHEFYTGNWH